MIVYQYFLVFEERTLHNGHTGEMMSSSLLADTLNFVKNIQASLSGVACSETTADCMSTLVEVRKSNDSEPRIKLSGLNTP